MTKTDGYVCKRIYMNEEGRKYKPILVRRTGTCVNAVLFVRMVCVCVCVDICARETQCFVRGELRKSGMNDYLPTLLLNGSSPPPFLSPFPPFLFSFLPVPFSPDILRVI